MQVASRKGELRGMSVVLAPGAENNGLASMLAELLRQNLESKPHKLRDFNAMNGRFAIVAEDAEVAMTLHFQSGTLTVHDGIVGFPDVTVRGSSDIIIALSNMPLHFGFPVPDPRNPGEVDVAKQVMGEMRTGKLVAFGALFHVRAMSRLTRIMSVHG